MDLLKSLLHRTETLDNLRGIIRERLPVRKRAPARLPRPLPALKHIAIAKASSQLLPTNYLIINLSTVTLPVETVTLPFTVVYPLLLE